MLFGEPFGGVIPGVRGAVLAALLRTETPLTGRQVHGLVSDYSLWTVQGALKALMQLGLINTQTVGRAGVHTVNEDHVALAPLRALLDPIAALTVTSRESVGDGTGKTVILFGSVARGEAHLTSDIDLAVIAAPGWDGRTDLENRVRTRLGNNCDVLVFTPEDFAGPPEKSEPVIREILRDGVALIGPFLRVRSRVAT